MMARRMLLPVILSRFSSAGSGRSDSGSGWIDGLRAAVLLILSLIATFSTLVWWNARAMSMLARQRHGGGTEA